MMEGLEGGGTGAGGTIIHLIKGRTILKNLSRCLTVSGAYRACWWGCSDFIWRSARHRGSTQIWQENEENCREITCNTSSTPEETRDLVLLQFSDICNHFLITWLALGVRFVPAGRADWAASMFLSRGGPEGHPSLNIFISAGYWKLSTIDEV